MSEPLSFLIRSAFDASGTTAAMNAVNKMDSQISRLSKSFGKMMGLFGGGAVGMAAISFLGKTNDAFVESEKAVNLFSKAYQNLGNFTRKEIQDQVDFADKLQWTTKYTDEQILSIQTQLVTYGLYGEELKKATQASLDLSVKTGSIESAAKLMGKAFQGQTETLAKYGIKIDANIKGHDKYAAVIREVDARLGGLAATEGESLGASEKLGRSVDDLYEKIGALVNGPLTDLVNVLIKIVGVIPQVAKAVYDGDVALEKSDGTLTKVWKSVWNNVNIFKALGGAAEEATKKIMGVKPIPEDLTSGKPGRPTIKGVNPDSAEEIKAQKLQQSEAIKNDKEYAHESEKISEQIADIEGLTLTDRGQKYTRFFGKVEMDNRRNAALQGRTSKQLQMNNKQMLDKLEQDYSAAGKTFSGGWKQAMDEMGQAGLNWKQGFDQMIGASMGPATEAFKTFFDMSKKGFGDMGKLAEGVFKGIRDSFYEMLMQMAARAAVYGFLSLIPGFGTASGGFMKFMGLSRAAGGPVPGPEGSPVPMLAHGGEFVLSANVVKAIKAGQSTAGISGAASAGVGGGNITYSPTIQINGGVSSGNVRDIARQLAEAGRKGMTEALDLSKVMYKQGAKRSGETAL